MITEKIIDTSSILLSRPEEAFQSLETEDAVILLSCKDVLSLGEETGLGSDYQRKSLYVYAEDIVLSKELLLIGGTEVPKNKLRGTIIACHSIRSVESQASLNASGKNGEDQKEIHMDPKKMPLDGGNGGIGGDVYLYTESTPDISIDVRGGNGGTGQNGLGTTSGGNGGDGGKGGRVVALIIHPYLSYLDRLRNVYQNQNFEAKKKDLEDFLLQINESHDSIISAIKVKLKTALSNSKNVSDLNDSIDQVGNQLKVSADVWQIDFPASISGGLRGTYGSGAPPGKNGESGKIGTKNIVMVGASSQLGSQKFAPFIWTHPAQCAMLLEKAKLAYFSLAISSEDTTNSISNLLVLLKRIQQKTEPFSVIKDESELSLSYKKYEGEVGGYNSFSSLRTIYHESSRLLTQAKQGLNIFGYDHQFTPLGSFEFYSDLFNRMIDNFSEIEMAYNNYYENLKNDEELRRQIKIARDKQKQIKTYAENNIKSLKDKILGVAGLIDSYQFILPPKKKALEDELKRLEEEIKEKEFSFNIDSFLSGVTMLAFAPESKLMWVTQAAQIGEQGTRDLIDDYGGKVNKKYLVNKIASVEATIDSLIEGYKEQDDGSLALDDPGATKLIALEDKVNAMLQNFYSEFSDIKDLQAIFKDYIDSVIERNNQILIYNSIIFMFVKYDGIIKESQAKIDELSDTTLKKLRPDLPQLTSFVSQIYYNSRSMIMEVFDLMSRAFRFWALTDENLIGTVLGGTTLPQINTAILRGFETAILFRTSKAVESFGANANRFPVNDPDKGVFFTLNKFALKLLKEKNECFVNIPVVRRSTSKDENPFAGFSNIRLTIVRVWVEGAKTADGEIQIDIIHTGKEKIVDYNDTLYEFHHDPRFVIFKYNLDTKSYLDGEDGKIGWVNKDKKYALIGPFTSWHIKIMKKNNKNLDLSKVTEVKIEFHGQNYSFR